MAEKRAPTAAETSPAVVVLDSDQDDRRAAFATPATKNMPAYSASGAIVSAPLSSIFGSALPSLVDDDSLSRN